MAVKKKPAGLDHDWVRYLLRYIGRAHVAVYRKTDGRIGSHWRNGSAWKKPVPVCLLTHTGRTSGRQFTNPLLWMADPERPDHVVIVASQGGRPTHPQWYRNLQANPEATVQIMGDVRQVRARTADPAERARLWPHLVDVYADFESYEVWTDREIPVVICEPR